MRRHKIVVAATTMVLVLLAGSALAQESSATIRTYQGVSTKVADPSLEVFYTIGEPKGTEGGSSQSSGYQSFGTMINVSSSSSAGTGGDQSAAGGGAGKEAALLRGHYQANYVTVSSQGVEKRLAWDQIRAMRFTRKPVNVTGLQLPPYVPHYKYAVSVNLMSGEQVEADYVNLGATVVRGSTPGGQVEIPWGEIEHVTFDR
jgi:hypothetical protein